MNDNGTHDTTASRAIAQAITGLTHKRGYPAELVFEGALRGVTALMMSKGVGAEEIAKMLEETAIHIRRAGQVLAAPVASS